MRLVLLQALPLDGGQWSGQMEILPGRTIAPTLYGLGDTIGQWAAGVLDAAGKLDAGGAEPLIVVGNSVGGSVALEMVRQAGDRISALVLVGTKIGHRPEPDFRDRFVAALEHDCRSTVRQWVDELLGPAAEPEVRARVHRLAEEQSLADLVRGAQVFHGRPDATGVAAGWTRPLVVVRGQQDCAGVAFAGLRQDGGELPSTTPRPMRPSERVHLVADCGHYVNLERPGEFNAILTKIAAHYHPAQTGPGEVR